MFYKKTNSPSAVYHPIWSAIPPKTQCNSVCGLKFVTQKWYWLNKSGTEDMTWIFAISYSSNTLEGTVLIVLTVDAMVANPY